jgi:hypothetical protein
MIRFRKRLRILYAAFTQSWTTFRCPCGAESYIVGTAVALDGQLCEACESREFNKWIDTYENRMAGQKEIA